MSLSAPTDVKVTSISISGESITTIWDTLQNSDSYNLTVKQYIQSFPLATITSSSGIRIAIDDINLGSIGSSLSTWTSQVGTNHFTTWFGSYTAPTIIQDSISGRKVVRFDGINNSLRTNNNIGTSTGNFTIMYVAKTNSTISNRILQQGYWNTTFGWDNNQVNVMIADTNQGTNNSLNGPYATSIDNQWRVFTFTAEVSPRQFSMRIGGVKRIAGGWLFDDSLVLGGRGGQRDIATNCDVAVLYAWDRVLSEQETLSYEYQLTQKYMIPTSTWNSASLVTDLPVLADTATATANATDRSAIVSIPFSNNYTYYSAEIYGTTSGDNTRTISSRFDRLFGFSTVSTKPLSVLATPFDKRITLSWSHPENNGGSSITGYAIRDSSSNNLLTTVSGNTTSTTITGLTNGISYTFLITPININGNGDSEITNSAIPGPTVPFAPTIVNSSINIDGDIEVSWLPNSDEGGVPVTGYRVTTEPITQTIDISGVTARFAKITNAAPLTTYTVKVSAVNSVGIGLVGSTTIVSTIGSSGSTTSPIGDISGVSNLKAGYDTSNNQYILEWTPPTVSNLTNYELRMNNGPVNLLYTKSNRYIFDGEAAGDYADFVTDIYTCSTHTIYKYASGKLRGVGGTHGVVGNAGTTQLSFIDISGVDWNVSKALLVGVASNMTAFLLNDGTVRVMSSQSSTLQTWSTAPIGSAKVVQIAVGQGYVALLLDNGKVMVRGSNNNGQLAQGNTNAVNVFSDVSGIDWNSKTVSSIYAPPDANQLYIVMTDGSLFFSGQHPATNMLGLNANTIYSVATPVPEFGTTYLAKKVQQPMWYNDRLHVLLQNGRIISVGSNERYIAGIGNNSATLTSWTYMNLIDGVSLVASDIDVGFSVMVIKMSNGDIYGTGETYYMGFNDMSYVPRLIYPSSSDTTSISAKGFLSYHRITSSKTVRVYGYNYNGVLGLGPGTLNSWRYSEVETIPFVRGSILPIVPSNRSNYSFTIRAIAGDKLSAPVSALVGDLATVPTALSAQSIGASTVRASWTASQGIVSGYNVYANNVLRATVPSTTVDISGLTNLERYNVKVEAVNQYGASISTSLDTLMVGAQPGLYFRYNDVSNTYSLLWDSQVKYLPDTPIIQLIVNGATQLIPNTVFDNYLYQGNGVRPVKAVMYNTYNNMCIILMSDGTIRASNSSGSLFGSDIYRNQFTAVPDISNVANCFMSRDYLYLTLNNGSCMRLYLWGNQITTLLNVTNLVSASSGILVDIYGNTYDENGNIRTDRYYNIDNSIMNIKPKFISSHSDINYGVNQYSVSTDGLVFSKSTYGDGDFFGRPNYNSVNQYYLLSDISNIKIKKVATAASRSIALAEDGRVLTCGSNNATRIGRTHSVSTPHDRFNVVPGVSNVVDIACNNDQTLMLLSNGRVLGFGDNNSGLLADISMNSSRSITVPTDLGLTNIIGIQASNVMSVFIHADGRVLVVGFHNSNLPVSGFNRVIRIPETAVGTSAISNTLIRGVQYQFSSRYFFTNTLRSSLVSSIVAPVSVSDPITEEILTQPSIELRYNGAVVTTQIVPNVASTVVTSNTPIVLADSSLTSTPIFAYYTEPATDADAGSAIRAAVNSGLNRIALRKTVASQTSIFLLATQPASVATPLTVTSPAVVGATAAITTTSAGSGNTVAAGITSVGTATNSFVNMYIKVVDSAGSIVPSGFTIPIEIDIPNAAARDSIVLQRYNTTTGLYEQVGLMTKKSGTTSTFQYTLTTNSNYSVVPCILGHTRVMTPRGPVAAAFLKVGDNLVMPDGRQVAIRQIYTSAYITDKDTAPYRFEKGSLGKNYPAEAFEVSPTHAVAVGKGWIIPKYASLSGINAKQVMVGERVKYYHIELEEYLRDNLLLEGGAVVESFGVNWLKSQPKGTVVYTFDHKTKMFNRPAPSVAKSKSKSKK